ncbi:MAG: HAD family phosphatase [Ignavibacteriae bacterium]|nr:HAD family phosphatase [Ignavibacteriota bacterium]
MKNYSAYFFDMDGTLVNSEKLKGLALSKTCNEFGGKVDFNIYKEVMGNSWKFVTNYFFEQAQINPNFEKFNLKFKIIYEELLTGDLTLNSNVKELLGTISEMGKKIGLVTSGNTWMVENILTQFNLLDIFDIIVTGEDVTQHKPHPQAYLLALDKLSLSGNNALVFEDSNAGLTAAKKANCDVVAFRHEFNSKNDLSLAMQVIADFNEIKIQE